MENWSVIQSPTDPEMYAVQGAYLVADKLPIEDAALIAAAPDLLRSLKHILGHPTGYMEPYMQNEREIARAAIFKAKPSESR